MDVILVTGGAGYIGAQTCKELAKAGFLPVTIDNLSTGHRSSVKWGPLVIGDLRDQKMLHTTMATYRPKGVLHFAANAIVVESMTDPGKYYNNNISSSISLLEAMREHEIPYFVFSSTCATYGHPQKNLISEEHPQQPINPYGSSKLMVERIIEDFQKIHGLCSVILRYFNAAGADSDLEHGENHTPETHLIPSLIQTACGLRDEFIVYGTDFPTPDGSAVRDYIHIEDLAKAHVQALKWVMREKKSTQVNLGTGSGASVLEILKRVEEVSQLKIPTRFEKRRQGEPAFLVADNKKAATLLDWIPTQSNLEKIIESAWKWHLNLTESFTSQAK